MTDSHNPEGPWSIWVCEICGGGTGASAELEPRCSCEPPLMSAPGHGIEVIPASALARAEQERDEARAKLKLMQPAKGHDFAVPDMRAQRLIEMAAAERAGRWKAEARAAAAREEVSRLTALGYKMKPSDLIRLRSLLDQPPSEEER